MLTVHITQGLPASGKSDWSKKLVKEKAGHYKRVNKDDLREMLDSSHWSKHNEKFILNLRDYIILTALEDGKHVIVDDTNLHEKHIKHIRDLVGSRARVIVKKFEIDPKEAIERDLKRPNSVGSRVIWDMYNKFLKPKEIKIPPMVQDENLPHVIICDLDGTVALMNKRDPYEWQKCDTDLPNKPVISVVENYLSSGNDVIFLSGRDGRGYDKTIKWLKENIQLMDNEYKLFMRAPMDNRKDCIIKTELFDEHIRDKYYVDFILDDRNQVVDLWRGMGLTCIQVAEGNF